MTLRRGDIVIASGAIVGEARPYLVVQSDLFNQDHSTVSVCPVTGVLGGEHLFRIPLGASADTGLRRDCEVKVDKVQLLRRDEISAVIGAVPAHDMTRIDDALRRWLEL